MLVITFGAQCRGLCRSVAPTSGGGFEMPIGSKSREHRPISDSSDRLVCGSGNPVEIASNISYRTNPDAVIRRRSRLDTRVHTVYEAER